MSIRRLAPRYLAVPLALLMSAGLVHRSTTAAFTATTGTPANTWQAGALTLSDSRGGPSSGTAMFTAANLAPGATNERCITVTAATTLPSVLRVFYRDVTATAGLDDHLLLTVYEGAGSDPGCGDFAAAGYQGQVSHGPLSYVAGVHQHWGNGYGSLSIPAGTTSRTYLVRADLSSSTPNSAQGGTAEATLVWEIRNT